jgi:hypothetical protein
MKVTLSDKDYVRVFAGTINGVGKTVQFIEGDSQEIEIPETTEVVVGVKQLGTPELVYLKEGLKLPTKMLVIEKDGTVRITKDKSLVLRSYLTSQDPVLIDNPKTKAKAEVINPKFNLKSAFLAGRLKKKPQDSRRIAKAVPEARRLVKQSVVA